MHHRDTSIRFFTIVFLIVGFHLFSPSSFADPVTQNDFIMMDTTWPVHWYIHPTASLDDNGIIYQTYNIDTIQGSVFDVFVMFNRYDKYGVQLQPTTMLVDYVDSLGTAWGTIGGQAYTNASSSGTTMMAIHQSPDLNVLSHHGFFHLIDSTGSPEIDPICAMGNPSTFDDVWIRMPIRGCFSGTGIAGISMSIDSVWVRLYYTETDSLSPLVNPIRLPHPLAEEPEWDGQSILERSTVMGVADDGSFVVAWIMRSSPELYGWHTYFVVYNADYTPRTEVTLVECDGSPYELDSCKGKHAERIDLAIEPDGDFYIAMGGLDGPGYCWVRNHIWVSGYAADGTKKYGPTRVDDADSTWMDIHEKITPNIACNSQGDVLVIWADGREFADCDEAGCNCWNRPRNLYAQKIDPNGNLIGPNYRINDVAGSLGVGGNQIDCDMNDLDQTIFTWNDFSADAIMAQLMSYKDIGTFIPGDINLSMSADIADLTFLVEHMFLGELKQFWPRDLIDINGDDAFGDIADLVYLVDYMFLGGPTPVTPDEGIRPEKPLPTGGIKGLESDCDNQPNYGDSLSLSKPDIGMNPQY